MYYMEVVHLRIYFVLLTYFIGVYGEYYLLLKPSGLDGELFDYLFLFGIIIIPVLLLFIIPMSIVLEQLKFLSLMKKMLIYIVVGAVIAIFILYLAIPYINIFDIIDPKYLFVIFNGSWFAVIYFIISEMVHNQIKKKAIQESFLDSQNIIHNHDMQRAK